MMGVWTLLLSLLFLLSCASHEVVVPAVCPVPPSLLLRDVQDEGFKGQTYRDLAEYTLELKQKVMSCNNDKRLLREWLDK